MEKINDLGLRSWNTYTLTINGWRAWKHKVFWNNQLGHTGQSFELGIPHWQFSTKKSRIIGVIAHVRHFIPLPLNLLSIYNSLLFDYYSTCACPVVWLLGVKLLNPLYKPLVQQKRVLQLMYFSESRAHAVRLFAPSKFLHLNML